MAKVGKRNNGAVCKMGCGSGFCTRHTYARAVQYCIAGCPICTLPYHTCDHTAQPSEQSQFLAQKSQSTSLLELRKESSSTSHYSRSRATSAPLTYGGALSRATEQPELCLHLGFLHQLSTRQRYTHQDGNSETP